MPQSQWLDRILSVSEDTPYHSNLATPTGEELSIEGDTVFRLENGRLTFQFFFDSEEPYTAGYKALAASQSTNPPLILRIPSRDFAYPARILSTPTHAATNERTKMRGFIDSTSFGSATEALDSVNIRLRGVPAGWHGNGNWTHYQGVSSEPLRYEESGEVILPSRQTMGVTRLSGFTLKTTDGWTIELREIPISERTDPEVGHSCLIRKDLDMLTGELVSKFLEEDLLPFLSFVFGQNIRCDQITADRWVQINSRSPVSLKTMQGNWFLRSRGSINLSPLFQHFCRLTHDDKNHWKKIIDKYAASEETMGTLGEAEIAASVSFAALEGLTRSIISTYSDKHQWLDNRLRLRKGKGGIVKAVEMVAEREFGRQSKTFRKASEEVYKVRNATMHMDLMADEDRRNAYHRWNSSQALIEILLLGKMGLQHIPNRTAHGKFEVMGIDMYEGMRKEELHFG